MKKDYQDKIIKSLEEKIKVVEDRINKKKELIKELDKLKGNYYDKI